MAETDLERLARLKSNLVRRALVFDITRAFFREQGFLEVNTPVRVPTVAPEIYITPFRSEDWFLSTSPELHMKRLLAAGYERLFQIAPCFRRGEAGRQHNPEFAMIEWYRAGGDYTDVMRDTEGLVLRLARDLASGTHLGYQGRRIDLSSAWPQMTVREAFLKYAGWDPVSEGDALRFDLDLVNNVIPALPAGRPVWLRDYPAAMAALARLKPGHPEVAERAEVFIGGLELANAYSELTDPAEQARRFREESALIRTEKGLDLPEPRLFLDAVPRMPDCGGIALGMDRLVMLFCDAADIADVLPFTAATA